MLLAAALTGTSVAACSKEDHPPYAAGCESDCAPLPGVTLGGSATGASTTTPAADAGSGSLTGQVVQLTDDGFINAALFVKSATVSAVGASAATVSGVWDGADPYVLSDVALLGPNWVSVHPDDVQGDALITYQAVGTSSVSTADLAVVSATILDEVITAGQTLRSLDGGQVVLFFRSSSTGAALSGLHVAMSSAQAAIFASSKGWIADDGTATTGPSGLVVFANVDASKSGKGLQNVTVSRGVTATSPALSGGTFAIQVVSGAVTLANVSVPL